MNCHRLSRQVSALAIILSATAIGVSSSGLAQQIVPDVVVDAGREPAAGGPQGSATSQDAKAKPPELTLDQKSPTGSRLGLTPRETPASVHILNAEQLHERGFDQAQDAIASFPGVIVGDDPIDPSNFSMRGFTTNQITVLRDGVYLGPSGFVNRPSNSFNLQSVEVLKGPASVLNGPGSVGGVVNIRTKEPQFGPTRIDAFANAGSFGTYRWGVGLGAQVNDQIAVRLDLSRAQSAGFVENASSNSLNLTGSVLWRPTGNFSLKLGVDALKDNMSSYYGTPLIPGPAARSPLPGVISSSKGLVIDEAMRFKNYNVSDALLSTTSVMPTAVLTWQPTADFTINDTAYFYRADRKWRNAETYSFIGAGSVAKDAAGNVIPAGSIARDRFYVYHDQTNYGNVLTGTLESDLAGFHNKFLLGADVNRTSFIRSRGFPSASFADFVDAWKPVQGNFGSFPGEFPERRSPTYIDDYAVLMEDVLSVTPKLKFVLGARYERQHLVRENYNQNGSFSAATSFTRDFNPFNLRAGVVYDLTRDVSLYGQYTTAKDPIGSAVFVVNAGQNFDLSSSRQAEVGVKADLLDGRGEATLALYDIRRQNILTQNSANTAINVGSQYSRGVELSSAFVLTPQLKIAANAAYTFARYGLFFESAALNDSGNQAPNVPTWTANLWTQYSGVAGLPLDAGFGLRYVGARAGNNSNSLFLNSYALADIFATYHLTKNIEANFRINNLFNKAYAQWAEISYPGEVILGAPRSFTFGMAAKF